MTNIHPITSDPNMRATEIVDTLIEAGFTTEQALGLTSVITAIRAGRLSQSEAVSFLEKNGFAGELASQLSSVFFRVLARSAA